MDRGNALGDGQVAGIQNLVMKSVSGLTRDNVAISDSSGNSLTANASDASDIAKISTTRQIESDIQRKVMGILEGPYGRNNVRISVTAIVDTDDVYKEERIYSPSQGGDNRGVINQETRSSEISGPLAGDGGIPGTDSNTQIPTYPIDGSLGENGYANQSESTSYSVSQVISQFQKDGARVESVSIGIAIDKKIFEPEEKERIQTLVAYAVGIDPENIAVENFSFYAPVFPDPDDSADTQSKLNLVYVIAGGAALFILIAGLVAFLLRRKKKTALALAAAGNMSRQQAIDELFGEVAVQQITPVRDTRKEQIKDFAETNPEIAAQMIRSWLKSDN
jgi:flagellar M-ring protein FliF